MAAVEAPAVEVDGALGYDLLPVYALHLAREVVGLVVSLPR